MWIAWWIAFCVRVVHTARRMNKGFQGFVDNVDSLFDFN
jgi:hypothetical protein